MPVRHPQLRRGDATAGRIRIPGHHPVPARARSDCFRRPDTARSGQQAALGADVIALLDALAIPHAIVAGYDRGGRAACVAAALRPDRVAGLVSATVTPSRTSAPRCSRCGRIWKRVSGTSSTSSPRRRVCRGSSSTAPARCRPRRRRG
ncbi:MAG TPA: alpha/beta fold hydrolase [Actinoplanes sp.]